MPGAPRDAPPDDRQDGPLVSVLVPGAPLASVLAPDVPSGDQRADQLGGYLAAHSVCLQDGQQAGQRVSVPVSDVPSDDPQDDQQDGYWAALLVRPIRRSASALALDAPSDDPRDDFRVVGSSG